ncbi:MAG: hypothetical protein ABIP54_04365, partial [Candidatus Andersenbacteria bacterium]
CYLGSAGVSQVGAGACSAVVQDVLRKVSNSGVPASLLSVLRQTVFGVLGRGSVDEAVIQ